jgi:hypothetical protein
MTGAAADATAAGNCAMKATFGARPIVKNASIVALPALVLRPTIGSDVNARNAQWFAMPDTSGLTVNARYVGRSGMMPITGFEANARNAATS